MPILKEKDKEPITERLAKMDAPVRIINFTQDFECQFCRETRGLMEELAALSDKLSIDVYDFQGDEDQVKKYNIDKIPATVIEGDRDHGIRFFGIPAGYEFATVLEAVVGVSTGRSGLSERTRERIGQIDRPLHLQVFVTPT